MQLLLRYVIHWQYHGRFSAKRKKNAGIFKYCTGRLYVVGCAGIKQYGTEGMLLYTAAYSLATIGIFAILVKMKDYTFEGFNGFAKHQPLLAAVAVIFLLSLAGIPLTAGFLAKFYMLNAAIDNRRVPLAGYICSVDGGGQCVLLFPCYTGNVF